MPPPKLKLHKNMGKARPELSKANNASSTFNPPSTSTALEIYTNSETNSIPTTGLTTEQEEQFQCELYWCIKQLQTALSTDKLSKKQVEEHTKTLNTLMSHNAPMIKKRQIMRLSFGDYRKKMSEDEKKLKKLNIKVSAATPNKRSMFLRKALANNTSNSFKFNFPVSAEDSEKKLETTDFNRADFLNENSFTTNNTLAAPVFSKSANSFRFNFVLSENINSSIS